MKQHSVLPVKVAKYGYILISVVFCIAGIAIILLPAPPLAVIGTFFGSAMLIFGLVKLVGYFSKDLFRLAFQYDLQFGILLIVLGIITLIKRADAAEFICIAYGVCMIIDCLFKIKIALDAKSFGIHQWWLTFSFAILNGIAGILVTICPTVLIRVASVLIGISLLTEGILSLSVAISMIKVIDHKKSDVIQTDEYEIWEET